MRAKRVAVKVVDCERCHRFHMECYPVAYLGREEFRRFMRVCRSFFMDLKSRWVWVRSFEGHEDARALALHLAREFGELFFLDADMVHLTPPETDGAATSADLRWKGTRENREGAQN